ncbi:hypothetical protein [Anaerolinea sp.]|uniref:hypothetical protein n=1 Tax=Anaerolinea sp. TaxID=1872519 RepID=UPI002ACDDF97|nr:hypothetical protein [Anaerolinea sp.]
MSLYEIGLREKRARKLGEILNEWGGFPLMVSMCEAVGAVNLFAWLNSGGMASAPGGDKKFFLWHIQGQASHNPTGIFLRQQE